MSIKKKLPLLFCLLVFIILVTNNAFHYIRSKNQLISNNNREISMITKEISYHVKNTTKGSLYVEDILGRDLRIASLAIKDQLPPRWEDVSNEQLKQIAKDVGVSHITLLAKTDDDIIGVKSSDPQEINMATKGWGYWYDAYQQLFALKPVTIGKGLTLPNYWSGPIEVASSNPDHVDKWGYYYDGTTNYIINPYFRDSEAIEYEDLFGPKKIIKDYTKQKGILELTVFNPKNFGKKKEFVQLNGNNYMRISARPVWYGQYKKYPNYKKDTTLIQKAMKTGKTQSYKAQLNGKSVMKTFVPDSANGTAFVTGLVYDYGLIENELAHELKVHILLSIIIMIIVLIISFIFSNSITRPIGYIVDRVNEIAKGNFGKKLHLRRKDELGMLAENVNALSMDLHNYVTDLQQSREFIEYQANHDPLTGLLNRRYFQEKLPSIVNRANQNGETLSIIFMDMDRFKEVNDSFGHSKGDEILKMTASRIKDSLANNENHFIIRQGGDEFIILLFNYNLQDTKSAAESIISNLKAPYFLNETEIYMGASCGVSIYPKHTDNIESLIIYADTAMYTAKKMGGNKVVVFSEQLRKANIKRPQLEARLRKAIENELLEVYYQPKMNVKEGTIFGVEALLRWTDDELGVVSPEIFIPIAEETELIQPIWEFVMKTACSQVSIWNRNRPIPLSVGVNFSARQFQEPRKMVTMIEEILANNELRPDCFEIEITESILLNNSREIVQSLRTLKSLGISISIDDFGTGYSSLSYLKDLPIDCLKIDKSFIQNIEEDYENSEIPEAIINLGRSLKLKVIAEGVEKEYQKEFLLSRDCCLMQGYLFSRPLNKSDFEEYLRKQKEAE
ncbi:bifunctional diguanylate cyclase/phosphodiesterase [Neobacillus rhizophilus]|uniref:EAL domain-containing protein n=1 Tax=Neobacillus rhizophilus TaxID=2833579 RepID=A0A942U698_9BACI|nr:EAL domain-containing protein [Neobacillus rhizophilus]MBS4213443.1 EAL domain-containing protein [Neobacillus rhizophilus]MBU8914445.1 EAL domain-containing protein [Bacillus sp. FJAT-29953]